MKKSIRFPRSQTLPGEGFESRIPIIDFARFLSIFLVMTSHFFYTRTPRDGFPPVLCDLIDKAAVNGMYGVSCFFVVSGFIITRMLVGPRGSSAGVELKSFYVKRAARLFPLLAAIVLAGFMVVTFHGANDFQMQVYFRQPTSKFGWGFWASILTFSFNWYIILMDRTEGIAMHWAVLWSLAVEEQFYLFYPLLLKTLKHRNRIIPFLAGVVVAGELFRAWVYFGIADSNLWIKLSSFGAFDQIALGALAYYFSLALEDGTKGRPWISYLLLILGGGISLGVFFGTSAENPRDLILGPTIFGVGCAMVILGGVQASWMRSAFWRTLSWPGKFSYGCYLWHVSVLFFLWPLTVKIPAPPGFGLFLLVTWSLCCVSYYWFELPANYLVRAFFGIGRSRSL